MRIYVYIVHINQWDWLVWNKTKQKETLAIILIITLIKTAYLVLLHDGYFGFKLVLLLPGLN